jgi:hypothetical protein
VPRVTNIMELHFGYNCKHFLPGLGKCRRLIDSYRTRRDLAEPKWIRTQELLTYLNQSNKELFSQITSGEIKVRVKKQGEVLYRVTSSWQYDSCYLVATGGQCLYFAAHTGKTIAYVEECRGMECDHSNYGVAPSEAEIRAFEAGVIEIIGSI